MPEHPRRVDPRPVARTVLVRSAGFALLWWVLSEGDPRLWWFGALAVAFATGASLWLVPVSATSLRLARLPGFVLHFAWQSVRGGIRVSVNALEPRPQLAPQVFEFHLELPPGGARVLLVCALSLMPGTLGVKLDGDSLRLHVLNRHQDVSAEVLGMQARIGKLFGVAV